MTTPTTPLQLPAGFRAHVANIGIKDTTDDFTVVAAGGACTAAGVFTQSSFAGPSVLVSRQHVADGAARQAAWALAGTAAAPQWPDARPGSTTRREPSPVPGIREAYARARTALYG